MIDLKLYFFIIRCRKAFESDSLEELLELIKLKSHPILNIRNPHLKEINHK
jgi:hypothetical protein